MSGASSGALFKGSITMTNYLILKSLEGDDTNATLDESGTFQGIASTDDLDLTGDIIAHGAITWNEYQLPPLLWSHDPATVLGTITSLEWTDQGLHVSGQLALEVPKAQEVYALIRRGAMAKGISVGITVQKTAKRSDGVRIILAATLHEVSLVSMPANPHAGITDMKSNARERALIDALRKLLFHTER